MIRSAVGLTFGKEVFCGLGVLMSFLSPRICLRGERISDKVFSTYA